MTTLYLSPVATMIQQFSNLGQPLSGGLVYLYNAGTTTPLTGGSWTDSTGTTQNANPISLNSAGRLASSSGASVGIWLQSNTPHKCVITDSVGNILMGGAALDYLTPINDPSALYTQLLLGSSGSGVDLVTNAVKSYASISAMYASPSPGAGGGNISGQALECVTRYGTVAGDREGGSFYWDGTSSASDDSVNVIKPTNVSGNGRWLRVGYLFPGITNFTFTGTLTGMTVATTGTVTYNLYPAPGSFGGGLNGPWWVVLSVANAITGTSNTAAMTMTGLPAAVTPASNSRIAFCALEDNSANTTGGATINSGGTIVFGLTFSTTGAFTAAGTKGLPSFWTLAYPL